MPVVAEICVPFILKTFPAPAVSNVFPVKVCVSDMPTIALAGGLSPPSCEAFKFATWVVLATENGAVPVATLLIICALCVHVPLIVHARFDAQNVLTCGLATMDAANSSKTAVSILRFTVLRFEYGQHRPCSLPRSWHTPPLSKLPRCWPPRL